MIHLHGPGTAAGLLPVVVDVYRDAFADDDPDELSQGVDWLTDARPRRIATPGFRLVLATAANITIGAVYGHQLRPGTQSTRPGRLHLQHPGGGPGSAQPGRPAPAYGRVTPRRVPTTAWTRGQVSRRGVPCAGRRGRARRPRSRPS